VNHQDNQRFVKRFFDKSKPRNTLLTAKFVDDADGDMEAAEAIFDSMLPGMAYLDSPDKPMATSVFECGVVLSVYLALRDRGVDVHDFGGSMLAAMAQAPRPEMEDPGDGKTRQQRFAEFIAGGEASQRDQVPGEFVFEAFADDGDELDWGMNIKSCAICAMASKYDAMELVPYMCATDDIVSDRDNQGLRRSGSIAVGAEQCDFVYKRGGEPKRLAELYPQHIKVLQQD
jgi:hypothetical protein